MGAIEQMTDQLRMKVGRPTWLHVHGLTGSGPLLSGTAHRKKATPVDLDLDLAT